MKNNLKENNLSGINAMKPAKRIDIVSLKMVKENSITYSNRDSTLYSR